MWNSFGFILDHVLAQAPTTEGYDALTKQLNTGLQKVFKKFEGLRESLVLSPVRRVTDARGGEGPIQVWKPALEFVLWDEIDCDDEEVKLISFPYKRTEEGNDE